MHVSRWITTHGFALNVSCDLEPFSLFNPCGHEGLAVTSVERETGREVSRAEVAGGRLRAARRRRSACRFEEVPVA